MRALPIHVAAARSLRSTNAPKAIKLDELVVTPEWQTMEAIDGLKQVKVSDSSVDIDISWGNTPEKATTRRAVVLAGKAESVLVAGKYIGWRGSSGAVRIEQFNAV